MALDLRDCTFFGPALPEPFVRFQLEGELLKRKLLPKATGAEGKALQDEWDVYRRKLRALGEQGGDRRVANHVLEPLTTRLGYERLARQTDVITREGPEDGGWLLQSGDGGSLRSWAVSLGTDLDAPARRGRAYRFSPSRVAQRVLLAKGERVGLLTDGEELRLLLCDPARPDSHIAVRLDRSGGWRAARSVPDSFRLLVSLASPGGVAALPDLAEEARLAQSTVTKKLRLQARRAIEGFLQEVLDHPRNEAALEEQGDREALARGLWREGLVLVYRLLFVFKLEASADPARAFSFAATSLWRNTYSPNIALAPVVRRVLDEGADTGGFLEASLRALWRMFVGGMSSSELEVKPLGGMLFGEDTTPLLEDLAWGERAVARLLDALLWTPGDGKAERERVHYGALDVEDLGRVYEALLELEPGITSESMCRLRRAKLEVVLPLARGEPYRSEASPTDLDEESEDDESSDDEDASTGTGGSGKRKKSRVQFIEEIPAGRFYLRVGLGRKASGSYYTPHPFVRFLVQETLGPQLAERSPKEEPRPGEILKLKVLDPAMGSGHFLVEACRYLGEALYEACRLCDELAVQAELEAPEANGDAQETLLARAKALRQRVEDLPDPEDELLAYLPSRAADGEGSGLSQRKAEALCRRLVAVHCLYGVDKNPLAVELAKLSLWLESYAEGLPLTFMDHRLICGDSLTGPLYDSLLTLPVSGQRLDDLFARDLTTRLKETLLEALEQVRDLESSVGKDMADLEVKRAAKCRLDSALHPLRALAAVWSGSVMLGSELDDDAYRLLARAVADSTRDLDSLDQDPRIAILRSVGGSSAPFDLAFPEIFFNDQRESPGFDAVVGNPPWEVPSVGRVEFLSAFDLSVTRGQGGVTDERLAEALEDPEVQRALVSAEHAMLRARRGIERVAQDGRPLAEVSAAFLARMQVLSSYGIGVVMPSSFRRNKTQAWLRRNLLESTSRPNLKAIAGFINKRRLFPDLPPVLQYDLVLATCGAQQAVRVGFAYDDASNLFASPLPVEYPVPAIVSLNPGLYTIAEIPSSDSAAVLRVALEAARGRASEIFCDSKISLSQEVNQRSLMPYCKKLDPQLDPRMPEVLKALNEGRVVPLYESKSLYQFDANWTGSEQSSWNPVPQFGFPLDQDRPIAVEKAKRISHAARFYRICLRETCGSTHTNERSAVGALLPPGVSAFHSAIIERSPGSVSNASRCAALAVVNTFMFDFVARPQIGAHLSLFILSGLPWPYLGSVARRFLSHASLRLSCNHAGYAAIWTEQLGSAWRERKDRESWPAIGEERERWEVRASIDAVVADAYGVTQDQYNHVLQSFTHKNYSETPQLCLAAFNELQEIGLDAFVREHDPYWDIPLIERPPEPVIALATSGQGYRSRSSFGPLFGKVAEPAETERMPALGKKPGSPSSRAVGAFYDVIARLLDERCLITSGDAQDATGLDAAGVRPLLRQLVADGRAVVEGRARGTKYRRVPRDG